MRRVLICLVVCLSPVSAAACDEYVTVDRAQAADLMAVVRDAQADPLDQLFAFETLMCASQPGLRDLALRTGVTSGNPSIQGQVVLRALLEKEVVAVELVEAEGLSKQHYEVIAARPYKMLSVTHRDFAAGCLSFHSRDQCEPASVMTITGVGAVMNVGVNNDRIAGEFRLDGAALMGQVMLDDLRFAARISLF